MDDNTALLVAQLGSSSTTGDRPAVSPSPEGDVMVMSVAAMRHIDDTTAAGEARSLQPFSRHTRERSVLDLSLPWEINIAGHRCRTCDNQFGITNGFPVSSSDVQAARPDILVHRAAKSGTAYMTRRFVLHCVQQFNETLNSRHLRRDFASLYAAPRHRG